MKIINGEKRGRPSRWLLDFYDQDRKRRWETYPRYFEPKNKTSKRSVEMPATIDAVSGLAKTLCEA